MTTVLAAVDGTDAAIAVLATAAAFGAVMSAQVEAVHVGSGESPRVTAAHAERLGVPLRVVPGTPAEQIIATAEQLDAELIVLAAHGSPGLHEPGETARDVATRSTRPVIVVPPSARIRPEPRRVLVSLDGSGPLSAALRSLIVRYVGAGAEVVALHVFEPATVPRFLDGAEDAQLWREEFLAVHCAELGVRLETRPGPTCAALLAVAQEEDADVIAMGWHQDLSPQRAAVVREVLAGADRPVALVPIPLT